MPTQPLTLMSALQGTYTINDTTAWTGVCDAVYVTESAVFSVLTDSEGLVKGDYVSTPATAVKAGTLIRPVADAQFTAITLTSGQVTLIL